MCFNGIGNMYKVHAFHHKEHVLLGLWGQKTKENETTKKQLHRSYSEICLLCGRSGF